jgi:hypothetical protein
LSILNRGEFLSPGIVGLFFESKSRQLEIKSKIRPNSFFRVNTPVFAKDLSNFNLCSLFCLLSPGNPMILFLPFSFSKSLSYSSIDLKWNFLEFSFVNNELKLISFKHFIKLSKLILLVLPFNF